MKEWIENKLEETNDLISSSYTIEFKLYYEGQRDAYKSLLKDLEDYNINNLYTL